MRRSKPGVIVTSSSGPNSLAERSYVGTIRKEIIFSFGIGGREKIVVNSPN